MQSSSATPRDRWIDEGMAVLREHGIDAVRIDRLAARLGLTKGSFHHHFRGADDFRAALIDRYESDTTTMLADALVQVADLPPEQALVGLPAHIVFDPQLEGAVRGWAFHDERARAALERIDASRLDALTGIWEGIVTDRANARPAAMVPYLAVIGATVARPTPTQAEMTQLFEVLSAVVPAVPK